MAHRIPEPSPDHGPEVTNSVGMKLKLIRPGTFMMGSQNGLDHEKPVHEVTITKPFYLAVCPVTQAEYEQVMGTNPSRFKGPSRPVERVTWQDAQEFCFRLSMKEGQEYRLPTEAEWEYACRAGATTEYCFGDSASDLGEYAWSHEYSGSETHDVGQKKANAWGLHDMHGNVWEWCQDWYGAYSAGAQADPAGPSAAMHRVLRGGSWDGFADICRCAFRFVSHPDFRFSLIGFRVAKPLPGV